MKNISISLSGFTPTSTPFNPNKPPEIIPVNYQVQFSATFEKQQEAIEFTQSMLQHLQNFNSPSTSIAEQMQRFLKETS